MSIEDANKEKRDLLNKLNGMNRGKTPVDKRPFLTNVGLFLSGREKILNRFKSKMFPTKNLEKTPIPEASTDPSSDPTLFGTPKPKKS